MRGQAVPGRFSPWRSAVLLLVTAVIASAPGGDSAAARQRARLAPVTGAGSVPFQRIAGRIVVSLDFVRPDGQLRPALAWVNMGTPTMALETPLARELGVGEGRPLAFRLGTLDVQGRCCAVRAMQSSATCSGAVGRVTRRGR